MANHLIRGALAIQHTILAAVSQLYSTPARPNRRQDDNEVAKLTNPPERLPRSRCFKKLLVTAVRNGIQSLLQLCEFNRTSSPTVKPHLNLPGAFNEDQNVRRLKNTSLFRDLSFIIIYRWAELSWVVISLDRLFLEIISWEIMIQESPIQPLMITSPDGDNLVSFELKTLLQLYLPGERAYNRISYKGRSVLADSQLGLDFKDLPPLDQGFEIVGAKRHSHDSSWKNEFGAKRIVCDNYNELIVSLREHSSPGRRLNPVFHAYNEGASCNLVPRASKKSIVGR